MKTLIKVWISLLIVTSATAAQAATYKYNDLIIKDYDEMNAQVQSRIKKARAASQHDGDEANDHEAIEILRDALKLIFSRPNSDNMVSKLTPEVRRELTGFSAYEDSISSLVAEELAVVKNDGNTVSQRSTALFVLENILSEIRPEAANNPDVKRIIQRIADGKIKVAEDVAMDRKMRSMYKTQNPSDEAKEILKKLEPPKKK
jgi:hypothetical protein